MELTLFTCLLTLEGDIPPKQYIIILFIIVVCGTIGLFYKTLISLKRFVYVVVVAVVVVVIV